MEDVSAVSSQKRSKLDKDHRSTTTLESLPHEIALNILSRLPVISLIHTKLVCRFLNKLTRDPLLINMHFLHVSQNDPCLILHCHYPIQNQLYLVHFSDQIDNIGMLKFFLLPRFPEFNVVGSFSGLLCLCDSPQKNAVYVYNPFIRNCIKLPRAEQKSEREKVILGFGFHPASKEYKVVRTVSYWKKNNANPHQGYVSEVQVFRVGGSTWRSIGQTHYHLQPLSANALANGRLHWLACRDITQCPLHMIVSFDLADEKFRNVSVPNWDQYDLISPELVILQGCLSAVFYCQSSHLDLWIMKEYDITHSWIKAFSIRVRPPFSISKFDIDLMHTRVLCILKNGEVLMEYKHRALVSYDPKSSTLKWLLFPGSKLPHWFEATVHIGSLNWIDNNINTL